MPYKNDKKISNLSSPDSFFQAQNAPKSVFGQSSAPDPAGGAYDAPPDTLVSPARYSTRRLRRLHSQAPSTQNPGYASEHIMVLRQNDTFPSC